MGYESTRDARVLADGIRALIANQMDVSLTGVNETIPGTEYVVHVGGRQPYEAAQRLAQRLAREYGDHVEKVAQEGDSVRITFPR